MWISNIVHTTRFWNKLHQVRIVHTTRFWNNLHQVRSPSKVRKLYNLKVFGSKKAPVYKQVTRA